MSTRGDDFGAGVGLLPAEDGEAPGQPPERADEGANTRALWRLGAVLVAGVLAAILLHGLAALVIVLALVTMIMLHELGHFATAKWSGMKVTQYFLGFGPTIWSVRRGETTYGVKAVPAGGYVRIVGMTMAEEVDPVDEPRSYRQATFPRRLAVGLAGSFMHFVMAFLLLWALFAFAGVPQARDGAQVESLLNVVGGSSPAQRAGIQSGDVIESVDGQKVTSLAGLRGFIQAHPGDRLRFGVLRGGRLLNLEVTPTDGRRVLVRVSGNVVPMVTGSPRPVGFVGIEEQQYQVNVASNPLVAIGRAGAALGRVTQQVALGFAQVFSFHGLSSFGHDVAAGISGSSTTGAGTTGPSTAPTGQGSGTVKGNAGGNAGSGSSSSSGSTGIISVVGAAELAVQALHQSISVALGILVAINISIGLINLFPMLPFDGGHVAIAVYERLRSRRGRRYYVDVRKLMPMTYLVIAFMLLLGTGAVYLNIVHPVHLPGG